VSGGAKLPGELERRDSEITAAWERATLMSDSDVGSGRLLDVPGLHAGTPALKLCVSAARILKNRIPARSFFGDHRALLVQVLTNVTDHSYGANRQSCTTESV